MKWLRNKSSALQWPKIATETETKQTPLRVRLMWMGIIWSVSVAVLLVIAYVLRWVLIPAR